MAIREGRWDCPQCGHVGNLGSQLKCQGCNRVRADEVEFYLPDDAEAVTDEAALARANAGADWICEFCEATTPATQKSCKSCGAPKSDKSRAVKELLDAPAAAAAPPKKKGGKLKWALAALAVVGSCVWALAPKEKDAVLERVSWERSVEVEKFATVIEEDWRDELPSGARILSTERREHHKNKVQTGTKRVTRTVREKVETGTKQVKVGTRDKGNGYFEDIYEDRPVYETREREVSEDEPVYRYDPVYQDWCRYEIDKWVKDRVERAEGQDLAPKWPEVRLAAQQREGKKTEVYRAIFKTGDGDELTWDETPFAKWRALEKGRQYKVTASMGSVSGLADP